MCEPVCVIVIRVCECLCVLVYVSVCASSTGKQLKGTTYLPQTINNKRRILLAD